MVGTSRRAYLKAHELLVQANGVLNNHPIEIVSPVRFFHPTTEVAVPLPDHCGHAQANRVERDGLALGMTVSNLFDTLQKKQGLTPMVISNHELFVPWGRILDVWTQTGGTTRIFLLLDLSVRCQHGRYSLSVH